MAPPHLLSSQSFWTSSRSGTLKSRIPPIIIMATKNRRAVPHGTHSRHPAAKTMGLQQVAPGLPPANVSPCTDLDNLLHVDFRYLPCDHALMIWPCSFQAHGPAGFGSPPQYPLVPPMANAHRPREIDCLWHSQSPPRAYFSLRDSRCALQLEKLQAI